MCIFLKILELFYCSPEIHLPSMSHHEFIIRLCTYTDTEYLDRWRYARSTGDRLMQRKLRQEAFRSNLHLLGDGLIYYALINAFALILPPNPREIYLTYSRWDYRYWLLMHLTGWGSFLVLALAHAANMSVYGLVLGVKIKPMFARPYLATSVRDFWSRRWNLCFKDQFYRIVFHSLNGDVPPMPSAPEHESQRMRQESESSVRWSSTSEMHEQQKQEEDRVLRERKKKQTTEDQHQIQATQRHHKQAVNQRALLAAFCTFVFSGLIHDYYAFISFGRTWSVENSLYFLLNFLMCSVQIMVFKWWPWLREWHLPTPILVVMTHLLLLSTMPFFQAPYLQAEFYLPQHLQLPYVVEHGKYAKYLF